MSAARVVAAACVVLAGVLAAAGGRPLAAQQAPTAAFRARADSVTVDVSVRERNRPVTGLRAGDFEVRDNGVLQAVSDLTYEALPIDVTMALDVSESVTGAVLEQLRRSVRELVRDLTPRDRFRLVTFNARISRALDFGAAAPAREAALDQLHPFGGTALFDAMAVALTASSVPDRRQLVVIFSDGEDSDSITEPATLLEIARRTTPTLSLMLASPRLRSSGVTPPPSPATVARTETYAQLARETGGIVESVDAGDSLSSAFRRMLTDFRSSYVLHFVPQGVEAAGFHALEVRVTRPGVEVRARHGYTWK